MTIPGPMRPARGAEAPAFLSGGGTLGGLIRAFDWASTPLGAPETWPQSLRSALSICLHSDFPTAIYWGPDLRLLYNDAWAPIPAERHPRALGRPAREVWADIWHIVGPQFEEVMATGEGFAAYDQMLPMVRDGIPRETYWNYSFTAIRGEDGQVAGVFNQGNETTQFVLARRKAEQDIQRFAHLFDQAPGAVAVLRGKTHVFEIANPAYQELVGRADLIGKPVADVLPEVVAQGFVDLLDRVYQSGEPYLGRGIPVTLDRGNGPEVRHLDFVYQPVHDSAGKRYGIFVQATDVSDALHGAQALRDSEAKYQAIVNSIDQMIWSTRPDGFHDYYNDRWYEFTGVPEGSTDGEAWNGMLHPDDQERAWTVWRHSLATGDPYHIEYRLRHRSGEYRWVIGRAQCIRDASGEIVRWFGTCTDIHEIKTGEERRQLLLRELNHRVKNLFSVVSGMVSMTARTASSPQEMGEALRGRLAALSKAHDLIRVGGMGPGAEAVPLEALIRELLRPHLSDCLKDQVVLSGPEVTLGEQASTALALILHELATNAAKYGGLATCDGALRVAWSIEGATLHLAWEERAAAEVRPPAARGFGSTLVKMTAEGQLCGSIAYDWRAEGLRIDLRAALARLAE